MDWILCERETFGGAGHTDGNCETNAPTLDATSTLGAEGGYHAVQIVKRESHWPLFNSVTSINTPSPTTATVGSGTEATAPDAPGSVESIVETGIDGNAPTVVDTLMGALKDAASRLGWSSDAKPQANGDDSAPMEAEGGPDVVRIVKTDTQWTMFNPMTSTNTPAPPDESLPSGFLPNMSATGGLLGMAPVAGLAKLMYDFDRHSGDVRVDDVADDYGTDVDGAPDGPTLIAEMRRSVLMYARLAASTEVVDRWEAAGAGRVAVRWVADSGDVRVAWWTLAPSGDADGVVPAAAGPQGALALRLIKGRAYDPRASRYAVRLRVRSDGPHRGKYLCLRPRADADGGGARVAVENPRPEDPSDHARFRWFVAASPPASGAAEGPSVRRVVLYNGHQNLDPPHWFVSGVSPARDGVTADTTDAVGPCCVALVLGDAEPAAGDVF